MALSRSSTTDLVGKGRTTDLVGKGRTTDLVGKGRTTDLVGKGQLTCTFKQVKSVVYKITDDPNTQTIKKKANFEGTIQNMYTLKKFGVSPKLQALVYDIEGAGKRCLESG